MSASTRNGTYDTENSLKFIPQPGDDGTVIACRNRNQRESQQRNPEVICYIYGGRGGRVSDLYSFYTDPDPDSEYGSGSTDLIESGSNPDSKPLGGGGGERAPPAPSGHRGV